MKEVARGTRVIAPGRIHYQSFDNEKDYCEPTLYTDDFEEIKRWLSGYVKDYSINGRLLDLELHISEHHFEKVRDLIFKLPLTTGTTIFVFRPIKWINEHKYFEVSMIERYRKSAVRDNSKLAPFKTELELVNYIIRRKISEKMENGLCYDKAYDEAYRFATESSVDTLMNIAFKEQRSKGSVWESTVVTKPFHISRWSE